MIFIKVLGVPGKSHDPFLCKDYKSKCSTALYGLHFEGFLPHKFLVN